MKKKRKTKVTSSRLVKIAAKALNDPHSLSAVEIAALAGSVLSQYERRKQP